MTRLEHRYPALSTTTCLGASLALYSCSSIYRFELVVAVLVQLVQRSLTMSHCLDSGVSSVANWDGSLPRRALVTIFKTTLC